MSGPITAQISNREESTGRGTAPAKGGKLPTGLIIPGRNSVVIPESEKTLLQKSIVRKEESMVIISSPLSPGGKINNMKLYNAGYWLPSGDMGL